MIDQLAPRMPGAAPQRPTMVGSLVGLRLWSEVRVDPGGASQVLLRFRRPSRPAEQRPQVDPVQRMAVAAGRPKDGGRLSVGELMAALGPEIDEHPNARSLLICALNLLGAVQAGAASAEEAIALLLGDSDRLRKLEHARALGASREGWALLEATGAWGRLPAEDRVWHALPALVLLAEFAGSSALARRRFRSSGWGAAEQLALSWQALALDLTRRCALAASSAASASDHSAAADHSAVSP